MSYYRNNGSVILSRNLTEVERKKVEEEYDDVFIVSADGDSIEIDEVEGDLIDDLNALVATLAAFGVKPKHGSANRYYGDNDGYDVFTGEEFESMDDGAYAVYMLSDDELIHMLEKRGYEVRRADSVGSVLKRLADKQKEGVHTICPRCGHATMRTDCLESNALSRRFDIYICPACGSSESAEDMWTLQPKLALEDWEMVKTLLSKGQAK